MNRSSAICFVTLLFCCAGIGLVNLQLLNTLRGRVHNVHCDIHQAGGKILPGNGLLQAHRDRHTSDCDNEGNHQQGTGSEHQRPDYEHQETGHEQQGKDPEKPHHHPASEERNDAVHFPGNENVDNQHLGKSSDGITLSEEHASHGEGEAFNVICSEYATGVIHWLNPAGEVLNDQTRPSTGPAPNGLALYFDNLKIEDKGIYSCSNGLSSKEYHLDVESVDMVTPSTNETITKRIFVAGSNCPEGERADSKGNCRETVE